MKRLFIPTLIILTALLGACTPAQDAAPTAEPQPTATDIEESVPQETTDAAEPELPIANADNPCLPFSLMDVLLANPLPGLPPVTSDDWTLGPEDAAVTFMEYSELQCPYCAQLEPLMMAIQEAYPDDVRIVFRHRPFDETFHDKSILGAQALEAAGKQGKFQEFKNFMFERQSKNPNNPAVADLADAEFWAGISPDQFDEWIAERVPDLGMDAEQFLEDMFNEEIVDKITQKQDEANKLGINGTPTLFINGFIWPEQQKGLDLFSIYTDLVLGQEKEYSACPPTIVDADKEYSATISTTQGDILVDLYADQAPYAVNSFLFLAREGWYDNMGFFATDEFVMTGDPSDTGFGGSGYIFLDEVVADLNFNDPGILSTYARLGPGLNTSTFFISKIPLTGQEGRSIFGKVTSGLEILEKMAVIQNVNSKDDLDRVLSITITEK